MESAPQSTAVKLALVIDSGLGEDAEQLATWGYRVTAFDISQTAIRTTRRGFPNTAVKYVVANLLEPPSAWLGRFDFIFEPNALQALTVGLVGLRHRAIAKIAGFLRPGGLLLVIGRGRELADPEGQTPWPLTRAELSAFNATGLEELSFEEFPDADEPGVRRLRVLTAVRLHKSLLCHCTS